MAQAGNRNVVVEIRGGTAVAMYADDPTARVILVDWDEFNADGRRGIVYPLESLSDMPPDTRAIVEGPLGTGAT